MSFGSGPWAQGLCPQATSRGDGCTNGAETGNHADARYDDSVEEAITVMYYGDHMSGWGWALASVGMVAFWGLVITAIVLL